MRLSKSFSKTIKDYPKDEQSLSAQLLIRGGYVDKVAAGIYTLLPLGLRVVNKISNIIREEINALEAQEILMSGLIPKANLVTTDRYDNFDALFKLKGRDEKEYALGATHEEIVSPLAKKFTLSYKDLPFGLYQIQNKFRNEARAKSGVLRTREFLMKDLYSFHENQEDLDRYYDEVLQSYWKIFERTGIRQKTYLVYASGGTFSKYSHEFQSETDAGEDEIYVCNACSTGVNKEIVEGDFECPECKSKEYQIIKAVEVGNIFKLGTKYSQPFELNFVDKDSKIKPVLMGCYGIGIQRLMGTAVELNKDEKGIIWPEGIAPYKYHLISLGENSKQRADEIYNELVSRGIEVIFDDRDLSAGEKFADADLLGMPNRLVVSEKTQDKIEIKKRNSDSPELLELSQIT
ncbi:MAG: Proline--tRNA ligase [candidate division WS2 bacterium ADurb.Bin280]|uniref:Proline--tRNA ligase n=1 Tax=candidate division WS2 bacterium ADurb.Bin280 TaxID=1852829 RepID=A0A1V5SD78_9BACT|nr:MAG: Proline--tRNA ligase [candidate division WS2 bacterium ADurb.Bin280]